MNKLSRRNLSTTLVILFLGANANAAEPATAPLKPDAVLASSAKASVTYEDLVAEISRIPPKDQFEFLMSRQRLAVVVENILINKTLAIEARERGLDKRPEIQAEIRNQIDKVLANTTALATSARFVPSIKDGKPNGFKLYAIRPGSMFAKIGMQNADLIKAINGLDMSTPDKALEAYTKLKSASHLTVMLERRNENITLDYQIR